MEKYIETYIYLILLKFVQSSETQTETQTETKFKSFITVYKIFNRTIDKTKQIVRKITRNQNIRTVINMNKTQSKETVNVKTDGKVIVRPMGEKVIVRPMTNGSESRDSMGPMTVWFVLGPMGAGKSSYINSVLKSNHSEDFTKPLNLVYLSPDIVKKEKNLTYLETRGLMEQMIQDHIDRKISFIIEGTGQHDDLYDLFDSYTKNPGIRLKVTFIDVDLDVALKRNKGRTRVLDDQTVREVYQRCRDRRHLWKKFGCMYIDYRDLLVHDQTYDHVY